jgi:hypothetical protein
MATGSQCLLSRKHITSARFRKPQSLMNTRSKVVNKQIDISYDNNIIVIDTETTGLFSRNANPEHYNMFDNARMVEIAWEVYNNTGELINRESYLIIPYGFTIPESSINIHGITNEMAHTNGVNIQFVFERLEILLKDIHTIVAHNFSFDNAIILAELYRLNDVSDGLNKFNNLIYDWQSKNHKCTMMMSMYIIDKNHAKWHKLNALYKICFNCEPDGTLHRAAADVAICAKIYFYLLRRSIIV